MIQNRDILIYYVTEIIRDYVDILEFEYSGVPGIAEIAARLNNVFKEARESTFGNAHPCFYKSEISFNLSAEEELPEYGPEFLKTVANLEKAIPRDDYLFLMAAFAEDTSLEAEYLAEAVRICPDKLHLHIAFAMDDDADNFPMVLEKLKAIPFKPVTGQEKNFFAMVSLLELIECRPDQCTRGVLTKLLKNVTLNPLMIYSIMHTLLHTIEKETLFEIFSNLNLPGNDKYRFGKLLMGAAYYRLGKYREAAGLLESADIRSCPVRTDHRVEFQYYLADSYRNTNQEGKSYLLIKEIYDEPWNKGLLSYYWYYTILDLAAFYLEKGMGEEAESVLLENETNDPAFVPPERLNKYYKMLGEIYHVKNPRRAHECYMKSELMKFNNN